MHVKVSTSSGKPVESTSRRKQNKFSTSLSGNCGKPNRIHQFFSPSPEHLPRFPRKQVTFPATERTAGERRQTGQNQPESGTQFLHKLWVSFENSTDCICSAGFSANQIAISIFYSHDRKSISQNQKDKRYNKIVVIFRFTFRLKIEFCRNPDRFS